MGEVIQMRTRPAARAEIALQATPLVDREIAGAGNRLALADPYPDLAAEPLAPLPPVDAVAVRRRELEADLAPAGLDGAALAVDRLFVIKKPSAHVTNIEF